MSFVEMQSGMLRGDTTEDVSSAPTERQQFLSLVVGRMIRLYDLMAVGYDGYHESQFRAPRKSDWHCVDSFLHDTESLGPRTGEDPERLEGVVDRESIASPGNPYHTARPEDWAGQFDGIERPQTFGSAAGFGFAALFCFVFFWSGVASLPGGTAQSSGSPNSSSLRCRGYELAK